MGQAAPASAQALINAPNSFCVPGAGSRPLPGFQPQPTSEIFGHVVDQFIHRLAAVALGILDLLADLAQRLAEPSHLDGRHVPLRVPRDLARIEIRRTMAGGAAHGDSSQAVLAAHDYRLMGMAVLALRGAITGRMAVDAARMLDDPARLSKQGDRALRLVLNTLEGCDRLQGSRLIGVSRATGADRPTDDRCQNGRSRASTHDRCVSGAHLTTPCPEFPQRLTLERRFGSGLLDRAREITHWRRVILRGSGPDSIPCALE